MSKSLADLSILEKERGFHSKGLVHPCRDSMAAEVIVQANYRTDIEEYLRASTKA